MASCCFPSFPSLLRSKKSNKVSPEVRPQKSVVDVEVAFDWVKIFKRGVPRVHNTEPLDQMPLEGFKGSSKYAAESIKWVAFGTQAAYEKMLPILKSHGDTLRNIEVIMPHRLKIRGNEHLTSDSVPDFTTFERFLTSSEFRQMPKCSVMEIEGDFKAPPRAMSLQDLLNPTGSDMAQVNVDVEVAFDRVRVHLIGNNNEEVAMSLDEFKNIDMFAAKSIKWSAVSNEGVYNDLRYVLNKHKASLERVHLVMPKYVWTCGSYYGSEYKMPGLPKMSDIPLLEEIVIESVSAPIDLTQIANPNLVMLRLVNVVNTDQQACRWELVLDPLVKSSKLESLAIKWTNIKSAEPLGRLTGLKVLELVVVKQIERNGAGVAQIDQDSTGVVLPDLESKSSIEKLVLAYVGVSKFPPLAEFTALKEFSFRSCDELPSGFEGIAQCQTIERVELQVSPNGVTNETLKPLFECPRLTSVQLSQQLLDKIAPPSSYQKLLAKIGKC